MILCIVFCFYWMLCFGPHTWFNWVAASKCKWAWNGTHLIWLNPNSGDCFQWINKKKQDAFQPSSKSTAFIHCKEPSHRAIKYAACLWQRSIQSAHAKVHIISVPCRTPLQVKSVHNLQVKKSAAFHNLSLSAITWQTCPHKTVHYAKPHNTNNRTGKKKGWERPVKIMLACLIKLFFEF